MMIGLDSYTATKKSFVGIDWLNLTSGALKTAGGATSTAFDSGHDASSPSAQAQAAAAEKAKLEAQKKADEQRMTMWKTGGAVVLAALGGWLLLRHRAKK